MGDVAANTVSGAGLPTYVVSTDVVVFTIRGDALQVLLLQRPREPFSGCWALPGGVLRDGEAPQAGAVRVIDRKVGLGALYLEQLYTFGEPGRDPRGRTLTVAYMALLPWTRAETVRAEGVRLEWMNVSALPALGFDHADIIAMGHRRLRSKLAYSTIALQLMGERFTLSELQHAYEVILGEALDKRNFRKRIQGLECVEATNDYYRAGSHRPARLYRACNPKGVEIIR